MKNIKSVIESVIEKQPLLQATKPKSLRPMRSMMAVRSLKSKTSVATMAAKPEVVSEKR